MPDAIQPDPVGAMRFCIQPRWAPGPCTVDHGMNRRDTSAYSELEKGLQFKDGVVVGVVYVIPRDDSSVFVATCFGTLFQTLRRMLIERSDERGHALFVEELRRVRPLFITATANGLYSDDLAEVDGALIEYEDPNDGSDKSLLVCVEQIPPAGYILDVLEERDTIVPILIASLQLVNEAFRPLDYQGIRRDTELEELRESARSAGKWLSDNSGRIRDVAEFLS